MEFHTDWETSLNVDTENVESTLQAMCRPPNGIESNKECKYDALVSDDREVGLSTLQSTMTYERQEKLLCKGTSHFFYLGY